MGKHSDGDADASDPPPSERLQKAPAPAKGTILRRLIFLAVMLVSLYVVWPSLVKVFSSSPELLSLNPVWFAVVLMAEIASFACAWSLQRIALRTGKWFGVATAQIVGNAFSRIVPGGPAAGGALQYRLLVRSGLDPTQVGTGLTSASLISYATLFGLPLLSIPAIVFIAPAPRGLTQGVWVGAALFVVTVAAGAVVLRTERPLELVGRAIQWVLNHTRRHRPAVSDLPATLVNERNAIREQLGSRWWLAVITSMGNWLFDYLALLAALAAVGSRPRPSLVLLAYVGAAVLGMIPLTPGGLGFVEAGLTALLALAGVPGPEAVLATLAYRLVAYWLPLIVGPIAYLYYRRRYVARWS
jgi:uncharacterized protein (TIRG00374 family)